MHRNNLWIVCFFLAGCVAAASGPRASSKQWERPSIALTDIEQVQTGMTYSEVADIMGNAVSIGYKSTVDSRGVYEEILIKNPYDTEILTLDETRYRVLYYFTHIRRADGVVADDELTPLVFIEQRLVGKGKEFLAELTDKLE